ncbi:MULTISPECIES: ComEA family DNA-binding protein [unclassified Pseudoalteromonas]|uniref:ComEA family DNA-binding protein n=1 Tax=unclassified Pseudoalteromonas TaxID=194690 RepID=UPI003014CF51
MSIKSTLAALALTLSVLSAGVHAEPTKPTSAAVATQQAVININTADVSMLATLPGIGNHKAGAIIEYRKKHGGFKQVTELQQVKGIGKGTLAKLEGKIKV